MGIRHRLAAGLSIIAMMTAGVGFGTPVLCIGSDGHAGIEGLLDGCCLPSEATEQVSGLVTISSTHACGDCTDVILQATPLSSRPITFAAPSAAAIDCPACGSVCRCTAARAVAQTETGPPSLTLAFLSSVILLT